MKDLMNLIRTIPDFPKKGILFRDITPLLQNPKGFKEAIEILKKEIPPDVKKIVAVESRGFIFGGALAYACGIGFVPVRKPGKLPYRTIKFEYELEYGKDTLEIHIDGIEENEEVVIVDDLLATGGTALATAKLVEKCGGIVKKILFLIELEGLGGREKLADYEVFSILKMPG